jgi:hypothetical protein
VELVLTLKQGTEGVDPNIHCDSVAPPATAAQATFWPLCTVMPIWLKGMAVKYKGNANTTERGCFNGTAIICEWHGHSWLGFDAKHRRLRPVHFEGELRSPRAKPLRSRKA